MSDGFINLNKPAGMTSHDAVNRVRKIFSGKVVSFAPVNFYRGEFRRTLLNFTDKTFQHGSKVVGCRHGKIFCAGNN